MTSWRFWRIFSSLTLWLPALLFWKQGQTILGSSWLQLACAAYFLISGVVELRALVKEVEG